jgi:protein-L-isoaspartate(D-aspartate) O-methyltransferase
MRFEDQRIRLVENLRNRGITNENILNAFLNEERDLFVPEEFKRLSYLDKALNIGEGQSISQPFIVAFMLQILELNKKDCVLEIGTGSGYQTALISSLVEEVFTIERIKTLAWNARNILRKLEKKNIHFKIGDGSKGWIDAYPVCNEFDKIIVSAGAPDIPKALISQLKVGGKMVIPIGELDKQVLMFIIKNENGYEKKILTDCLFVPLIGKSGWNVI